MNACLDGLWLKAHYQTFKWGSFPSAAGRLHVGARHGPRMACLTARAVSAFRSKSNRKCHVSDEASAGTRDSRAGVMHIDLISDLHVEGWASQWAPGSGEQQAV